MVNRNTSRGMQSPQAALLDSLELSEGYSSNSKGHE